MTKSQQMARVRSKNTKPELLVRKLLSAEGVRYRLHRADLPGRPDLYIGRLHLAVFINGCFWHGHHCARGQRPKTNARFWKKKIHTNIVRDKRAREALHDMGLSDERLWTCQEKTFPKRCRTIAERYREAT